MAELTTARLGDVFDLLVHPYRRYVLYYLTHESEVVTIDTLATAIYKWDRDETKADWGAKSKDVEASLRHIHLPKLADAGIILFDTNADSIELKETGQIDKFVKHMAHIDSYTETAAHD
ncbi:DUF7344 domain-containing protein [Halorussus salinisoli]|uniref:DUF7344 domain-containing protein n=1 Tax=Halorussus salinisoli TaxID=2558242 RepID=UPI0010C18579|nr:ArsR family transcriptional regulator [Halorussus salinisoli]